MANSSKNSFRVLENSCAAALQMSDSQDPLYQRKSVMEQLKDLVAERSLEIEYKFLKPPGYIFKLGGKVREGDFLVHCIVTRQDNPTQNFLGEGDHPYGAMREAAIKAKDFLTQGSQGNDLSKKVEGAYMEKDPKLDAMISWKFDYISKKIEAKVKDLKCSGCLEVASTPIFKCSEDHLICSVCRPKMSKCPECRVRYRGEPRRHRFAEGAAQEMEELWRERALVLAD